ncbi:hypothetical protein ACFZBP_37810 [Streptomyces sp. NPDC008086]|uniref:hypothetical protein n=1 Tax=Streptomyces sp. NPDC008086 TaxID=3364807 RepID=UPI0036EDF279
MLEEEAGAAFPLDHPLAGRSWVAIGDVADQPFVTARSGHWLCRLLFTALASQHGMRWIALGMRGGWKSSQDCEGDLKAGLLPGRRRPGRAPQAGDRADHGVSGGRL